MLRHRWVDRRAPSPSRPLDLGAAESLQTPAGRPAIDPLQSGCPDPMAAASPSSSRPREDDPAGAAICCMCGDHGLARELFRCKSCRVRRQHSYCSNLYPRAAAYRRCNWCLVREPPPAAGLTAAAATKRNASSSDEERPLQRRRERCSSPAELVYYPVVKKKRKAEETAPADARVKAGTCRESGESSNKETMRAGKARVKAQRYKLLAEVISC